MATPDIDFGYIVKRSFNIAWDNKYLWFFGIFSGGTGLFIKFDQLPSSNASNPFMDNSFDISNIEPMAILAAFSAVLIYGAIMAIIGFLCWGAIIDSVNRIERGGGSSFSTAFSAGIDNFLKLFGITLLFMGGWAAAIFIVVILMILLSMISEILVLLSLIIVIPAGLFIIYYFSSIYLLATRAIVVRRVSIGDGLEEGIKLVNRNMGNTILMFLMFIGVMIGIGILVMLFIELPYTLFVTFLLKMIGFSGIAAFIGAIIIGLPYSIIIGGFVGVVSSTFYTLYYFQLVDPAMRAKIQAFRNQLPPDNSSTPPPVNPSPNSPFGGE